MNKSDIALELTKLISNIIVNNECKQNSPNYEKAITDAYNYIYANLGSKEN